MKIWRSHTLRLRKANPGDRSRSSQSAVYLILAVAALVLVAFLSTDPSSTFNTLVAWTAAP